MPIADPEKRRAAQRRYYQENKEKWQKYATDERREYNRQWHRDNPHRRRNEDPEKRNARLRARRRSDPEWAKTTDARSRASVDPDKRIARRYRITVDELLLMRSEGCGICGVTDEWAHVKLVVDHDHSTGDVRGVLCSSCNLALGHFSDDPHIISRALRYILNGGTYAPVEC